MPDMQSICSYGQKCYGLWIAFYFRMFSQTYFWLAQCTVEKFGLRLKYSRFHVLASEIRLCIGHNVNWTYRLLQYETHRKMSTLFASLH